MIFCVCGGILEVGIIAAIAGWIGRVIFKRRSKAKKCAHLPKEVSHEEVPVS